MSKITKASNLPSFSAKSPLKVALVEDQPKVRDNWTRLLNSFPDLNCICACKTGNSSGRRPNHLAINGSTKISTVSAAETG